MSKDSGHKLRILHVLKLLWERTDEDHGLSVGQITDYLKTLDIHAERKTIYSDIETLNSFGYEIENYKGKNGGYRLLSRDFEMSELILLTDAVQSSRFITEKKSASLIKKLASLTSNYQGKKLSRQVHVNGRIKSMEETIFYSVDTLHAAIAEGKRINFHYFDRNRNKEKVIRHDGKTYEVTPLSLCWDDEYYYLVSHYEETDSIRHFRVDKMLNIKITDKDGAAVEGFDAASYTDKLFGMFGGRECFVTLKCKDSLSGVIIDRFGKNIPFRLGNDGYFELTAKLILSPVFYGWVMSFGGDIIIKGPDFAVEELKNTAQATLAAHE